LKSSKLQINYRRFVSENRSTVRLLIIFLILFGIMSMLNPQRFPTALNIQSMIGQVSDLAVMGLAMFVVVLVGNINLSIVTSSNLAGISCAMVANGRLMGDLLPEGAPRLIGAIITALVVGVLCGVLNGFFVGKLRLAPILVTVASMFLFEGIATLITSGKTVTGIPEQLKSFGVGSFLQIPYVAWLALLCYIVVALLLNLTTLGERIKLSGTNRTANLYSGGSNFKTIFITYVLSGLLSGISGIIVYAKLNNAMVNYGTATYINMTLLIVLLSGTSMNGGFGKVFNLFIASMTVQVISSGMKIGGFNDFASQTLWGVMLLVVIVSNTQAFSSILEKISKNIGNAFKRIIRRRKTA
jgi:simple sugar transport system permease protein